MLKRQAFWRLGGLLMTLQSAPHYCNVNNISPKPQVAEALLLEHQSPSLNPRGTLYRGHILLSIITDHQHVETLRLFRMQLEAAEYALYRVRRIYKGLGRANRAVEKLLKHLGNLPSRRSPYYFCLSQTGSLGY